MCGRFTLTQDLTGFAEEIAGLKFEWMKPRFNVAPSQQVAVVLNTDNRTVSYAKWGLIPSWAKDPAIGNKIANARAEGVAEKPSFRGPFKKRRCLILADGFYEWKTNPQQKNKTPYYFQVDHGRVFGFAGLWDEWRGPDGNEIKSCTIITTNPNPLVGEIHDRMPVILQPIYYPLWL